MTRRLLAALLLLLLASPVLAWNKPGHMVTAAIAYEALKQDSPETLVRVLELLRKHPKYADRFTRLLEALPAEDRDLYLLMIAARWADDVRRDRTYHRGNWHYINYPFKPEGQPDSVQTKPRSEPNIVTAFAENLATAKGEGPMAEKAIAVCWLFHLVGDVHQPLHTVSLFTTDYPNGDKGGNLIYVRARAGGAILNLHQLWDGLIIGSQRFQDVRNEATRLRLRPEFAQDKLTELNLVKFETWAESSFDLAKELAYPGGRSPGSPTRDEATPAVPEGYTDAAKAAAERQVILAGYRLAEVLRDVGIEEELN